jgi:hypothetical protein
MDRYLRLVITFRDDIAEKASALQGSYAHFPSMSLLGEFIRKVRNSTVLAACQPQEQHRARGVSAAA